MKKFFLMLLLLAVFSSLYGEKIYRRDGSFFEVKRNADIFAAKVKPGMLKSNESYALSWSFNGGHLVIPKDGSGDMPVYLVDANTIIADKTLFYGGDRSSEFIAKKYGLKIVEIWPDYALVEFSVNGDSIIAAQKIVENGDGFAYANIIRKMDYRANPVKFPIMDKYYKSGYQWSMKNTGKGIAPDNKSIDILKNADIRYENAMEFIYNAFEAGELGGFEAAKVAIMDSGVDFAHPDLKNKLEDGYNAVHPGETGNPGEIKDDGMYGTSGYSHGTNCAGVSAAEGNTIGTAGVCPWCGIYPVTYMEGGSGGGVSEAQLLKVYQKYVDDVAIGAINCSFGPMAGMGSVPVSNGEIDSHKNFLQNGRGGLGGAIVYASGNDGTDAAYYKLLDYKFSFKRKGKDVTAKVISVGASTAWDTRVAYSNYSKTLDIIAPSLSMSPMIGISTSYLVGYGDLDDDYTNQFSGTSSAAPVVTGFFGTIFSVNPELTLEEAVKILHDSADKINPETGFWDANGHSVKFGYGRVNLLKAVRLAAGVDMCASNDVETENNIDDNCDGFIDEGLQKDISKVGAECASDADCVNVDFEKADVECLKGDFKSYKFAKGYCTIKNSSFACPDGTAEYSDSQTEKNCLLECNDTHSCPSGYSCSDAVLGKCFPMCEDNEDCSEGAYCDAGGECKRNPSEPGGECEVSEDCKYGAMCITQIPGGFCVLMCSSDSNCGDEGAKCVKVDFGGQGAYQICLPSCEKDSECRSFGGQMTMKCHEQYNGKEDVCSMPCSKDADCFDADAECQKSRCVPLGTVSNDDDETSDGDTDGETDGEINDDGSTLEDDPISDEDTSKKKSDGCSALMM